MSPLQELSIGILVVVLAIWAAYLEDRYPYAHRPQLLFIYPTLMWLLGLILIGCGLYAFITYAITTGGLAFLIGAKACFHGIKVWEMATDRWHQQWDYASRYQGQKDLREKFQHLFRQVRLSLGMLHRAEETPE